MSLWIDKYRPSTPGDLDFHSDLNDLLVRMAQSPSFPHLMFYGPPGAGKKTRIDVLLREVYGSGAEKLRAVQTTYTVQSGKTVEVNFLSSNYHIEVSPSDMGVYDKVIVQELIKNTAQTKQIDFTARRSFKVVIIGEADLMTHGAQAALRRTMEKYAATLRVILCCNSCSKIIGPIRSRCLHIRVPAPETMDMVRVMMKVAQMEKLDLSEELLRAIAAKSEGNFRRAMLMLQAVHSQGIKLPDELHEVVPDWENVISELSSMIISTQSPDQLLKCREYLYRLISHCIPPEIILKHLSSNILCDVDICLKPAIIRDVAECDHRLKLGSKPIFHLEALVARLMSTYKAYLMKI